jgi:hypothetical protein
MLLLQDNHKSIYQMTLSDLTKVRVMNYQNEKSHLLKKKFVEKRERLGRKLQTVSLRDIPLDVRREEAKKPLFLTRYE